MGLKGDDILIVSGSYSNAPYESAPEIFCTLHFRESSQSSDETVHLYVLEQDTLSSA